MADDVKNAPNRVEGRAKVTGKAKYIAEFPFADVAHGYLVQSTVTKAKILEIETGVAESQPGVVRIFTHLNTSKNFVQPGPDEFFDESSRPLLPLRSDEVLFNGQPVALVVAETFEQARYAASLVKVKYQTAAFATDLSEVSGQGSGQAAPDRGAPLEAFAKAEVKIEAKYTIPVEHHNAMEPHASIAGWNGNKLTIYDKTQGVSGVRDYFAKVFAMPKENVVVLSPFVGGAFGAALRPTPNTFLAAMASRELRRPVKVVYSRRQLSTAHGYRPAAIQTVKLGADKSGKLNSIIHESVSNTSSYENFNEDIASVSRSLYACPNLRTHSEIAKTDLQTPFWMRAPGVVTGMFAFESALDELSYKLKIDPLELRLINYAETDPDSGKPFSSKELRKCYSEAAKRFGWEKRRPEPRSMKDGNWLVGHGMSTGVWGAYLAPSSARVTLNADGTALVESGTSDIGPGTYTTVSIIAARTLGLPLEKVKFVLGDSNLPAAPSQGGSLTTASVGTAVQECAQLVLKKLFERGKFGDLKFEDVKVESGGFVKKDGGKILFADLLKGQSISETHTTNPDYGERGKYSTFSHGAQFAEVKVDEELGIVRVTRVVEITAAGKIINPKGAHSQEIGGIVWGIGMTLQEETQIDHRYGRIMNPNLGGYYVPTNADVFAVETGFVEEVDKIVNPLGVKGLGEIGLVGMPAAIANAVYHATGKRFRDLPFTVDKLMAS
jgi:xanthine dehydrogenase YagR molybdenum-binding subunit